jgi:hypothetical protein
MEPFEKSSVSETFTTQEKLDKASLMTSATSQLEDKIIWNCGNMMRHSTYTACGSAMRPAVYGTDDVMTISSTGISSIEDNEFLKTWQNDPITKHPQSALGMDSSNVIALNETHGILYAFKTWRGAPDKSFNRRGNAVGIVTLGYDRPIATRIGPLLIGPEAVELGNLAILQDDHYLYAYTGGGPSRLLVTRVLIDKAFEAANYQLLAFGTSGVWEAAMPKITVEKYGMHTDNPSGRSGCSAYGSIFYSDYLNKYVIICNIYMSATNTYVRDTIHGPWS